MRLVLDTNVVVSALLWDGTPERLLELAGEGSVELATSAELLAELAGILQRTKFAERLRRTNLSVTEILNDYQEIAASVVAEAMTEASLRDPNDAAVLACARAARADLIVTGDNDLLVLKTDQDVLIVNPAEALRIISARPI